MKHRSMPADMGVPTAHKTAPAGRAYRVLAESGSERHADRFLDFIKVWRNRRGVAQMPKGIGPELIGVKNYDMRFLQNITYSFYTAQRYHFL